MTLVVGNIENIKNLQMIWKIFLLRKRTMSLSYNKIGTCRIKSKFYNTTNIYWVLKRRAKFFSALSAGTNNNWSCNLFIYLYFLLDNQIYVFSQLDNRLYLSILKIKRSIFAKIYFVICKAILPYFIVFLSYHCEYFG